MPINSKEISNEIEAMKKENASEKPNRKNRKELWKTQSLKDSLYNDDGKGNKIPRASDIDQGSPSKLNYILKQQVLGDCYLLTDLIGLTKKDPKFITDKLITVKNDNEVEVHLYESKEPTIKINGNFIKIKSEPGLKKSYSVKKDDAINWKTSHKALWPVVIEIAYAKHMVNLSKQLTDKNLDAMIDAMINNFQKQMPQLTPDILKEIKKQMEGPVSEQYLNNASKDLKGALNGGSSALALTHLTGKPSSQMVLQKMDTTMLEKLAKNIDKKTIDEIKSFGGVDTSGVKKFSNEYSAPASAIYNKIQNKLKQNKIITVSFKGTPHPTNIFHNSTSSNSKNSSLPKIDNSTIEIAVINLARKINRLGASEIFLLPNIFKVCKCEKWVKENGYTSFLDLKELPLDTIEKFILETADFTELTKNYKVSKTKTGISPEHAYLVLDALEHEEYKYIVLKNPHQMTTAINYKKSSKLPPEVKLPKQIDKVKNECMMELNHFYKKLASIDYDE